MALLSAAVFTRLFSAGEFGRFSLVLSVAGFVSAFASQWLQQGITRYLPGARDPASVERLRGAVALGLGGVWLVVGAAGVIVWVGARLAGSHWSAWIAPAALVALGAASFNALGAVLQAMMQARHYSVYRIAEAVLRFTLALAVLGIVARDIISVAWGAALSVLSVLPLMWRDAALPHRGVWTPEHRTVLRSLLVYGVPMVGWYLAALLLDVGDRLLIQLLRGPAEVGLYSANYNLVYGAMSLLAAPMLLAAHPFLMRAWAGGHKDVAGRWLGRIAEWYLVAGALAAGATWLIGRELSAVFLGAEFRPGWIIMAPLVAGLALWQLGMYLHKPLEFAGRTTQMFVIALGVAALKIVLNLLLIPRYGYSVVALTSLTAFALYGVATVVAGRGILSWRIDPRRIGFVVIPILAACWLGRGLPLAMRGALIVVLGAAVLWLEWRTLRPKAPA